MRIERATLVLLLNAVYLSTCHPFSNSKGCPRLGDAERKEMLYKLQKETFQELHWTFWLIPDLQRSKEAEIETLDNQRDQSKSTHLYGPKKCSKITHPDREYDCPTRYVMNHDVNRIPENMVYADCVCDGCRHDKRKQCQEVYTLTKVLRQNDDCSYNWAYEKVPVACACKSESQIVSAEEVKSQDVPKVPRSHVVKSRALLRKE